MWRWMRHNTLPVTLGQTTLGLVPHKFPEPEIANMLPLANTRNSGTAAFVHFRARYWKPGASWVRSSTSYKATPSTALERLSKTCFTYSLLVRIHELSERYRTGSDFLSAIPLWSHSDIASCQWEACVRYISLWDFKVWVFIIQHKAVDFWLLYHISRGVGVEF